MDISAGPECFGSDRPDWHRVHLDEATVHRFNPGSLASWKAFFVKWQAPSREDGKCIVSQHPTTPKPSLIRNRYRLAFWAVVRPSDLWAIAVDNSQAPARAHTHMNTSSTREREHTHTHACTHARPYACKRAHTAHKQDPHTYTHARAHTESYAHAHA